jgi:predicted Kef-type K+ transport protein
VLSTLLAAGLLFVDGLRHSAGATLFVAFGAALLLTIGALGAFLYEMMLASVGIRRDASTAADDEASEAAEAPESPASGD